MARTVRGMWPCCPQKVAICKPGHMRISGVKKKIYHMTYYKPVLNKKMLQMKKSFDEIKQILGSPRKKKT